MKQLVPFIDKEGSYHWDICKAKKEPYREMLLQNADHILSLYGIYNKNRRFLEKLQSDDSISRELAICLNACYTGSTKPLAMLKQQIKKLQVKYPICPYCGLNVADAFDHYLPKGKFPEFSIYSQNLIPICSQCNRLKSEQFLNGTQRTFINSYFDDFVNIQFLNVKITFQAKSDIPTVEFGIDTSNLSKKQQNLAKGHLKLLNLYDRYLEISTQQISEIHAKYRRHAIGRDLEELRHLLIDEVETLTESKGPNNWQVALYRALSKSDKFLKMCLPD